MPDLFISGGSRGSKLFVRLAVKGRETEANSAADHFVRGLQALSACGGKESEVHEITALVLDALGDVLGHCQTDLDNAGVAVEEVHIDLTELRALIAKEAA